MYFSIETMNDVDPMWPVIEDPENYTYIRPEGDGLMVGLFEGTGASWRSKQIPDDFSFGEIEPDWERMAPYVEAGQKLIYVYACNVEILHKYVCIYELYEIEYSFDNHSYNHH